MTTLPEHLAFARSKGRAKDGSQTEAALFALAMEVESAHRTIQQLLDHCQDAECSVCATIICPHKDEMHFHHDGCPSCAPDAPQD